MYILMLKKIMLPSDGFWPYEIEFMLIMGNGKLNKVWRGEHQTHVTNQLFFLKSFQFPGIVLSSANTTIVCLNNLLETICKLWKDSLHVGMETQHRF